MFRAMVFDLDGVILESVEIKTQAFLHLFRDQPEDVQRRIVRLHLENGGISRYEKFKWIYRDFLRRELDSAEVARLDSGFSRFCRERILAAPFVKGAREFLTGHHQEYLLYLVSGTPEADGIIRWRSSGSTQTPRFPCMKSLRPDSRMESRAFQEIARLCR